MTALSMWYLPYLTLPFIIRTELNIGNVSDLSRKFSIIISRVIAGTFYISLTPATCTLPYNISNMMLFVCLTCTTLVAHYARHDVHLNPGPQFQNNFFNCMSWNVNSSAKYNFQRVRLIEARNSIFNYDLISICETSLNDESWQ